MAITSGLMAKGDSWMLRPVIACGWLLALRRRGVRVLSWRGQRGCETRHQLQLQECRSSQSDGFGERNGSKSARYLINEIVAYWYRDAGAQRRKRRVFGRGGEWLVMGGDDRFPEGQSKSLCSHKIPGSEGSTVCHRG